LEFAQTPKSRFQENPEKVNSFSGTRDTSRDGKILLERTHKYTASLDAANMPNFPKKAANFPEKSAKNIKK
jgi:hypothetical protein